MNEIWKPVENFEDRYEISNLGNVRSLDRTIHCMNNGTYSERKIHGKILKQHIDEDGYCRISFMKYGKSYTFGVHRLVAQAFIPNLENLPVVNHIDGNKQNNCIDNLEWCTIEYNNHHAARIGLRPHSIYENRSALKEALSKKVRCINTGEIFSSMSQANSYFGLNNSGVNECIKRGKPIKGLMFELIGG